MTQRLSFLYLISRLLVPAAFLSTLVLSALVHAEAVTPSSKKSPEANFQDGMQCLKSSNPTCAQSALAGIPSSSPYAKVLSGNIAAYKKDFDQALLILSPLQANQSLSPAASASLHTSLALAYENEPDPLRALQHYIRVENYLSSPEDILVNQQRTWRYLSSLNRNDLVEVRGDSTDSTMQGWIDLALAAKSSSFSPQDITNWRQAYPDHLASEQLLQQLSSQAKSNQAAAYPNALEGKIALILPFSSDAFYPASDAIQQGFVTAQAVEKSPAEVKVYATSGDKGEIAEVYAQAVADGAKYVIGPLTRDEVNMLSTQPISVLTLALNLPDAPEAAPGSKLHYYGLSIDSEVLQIVKAARNLGMQTAAIVATDDAIANRMTKAFSDAWTADGGQVKLQVTVTAQTEMSSIKADVTSTPTDLVFLAATAESARLIRPHLDAATPTFGLSHIYSGISENPDDAPLLAVRFVDMPWLLDSTNAFNAYRDAAQDLPPGEMQRWFALGADAYRILAALALRPGIPATINGLSGKIRIDATGRVTRELAVAHFERNGVVVDMNP